MKNILRGAKAFLSLALIWILISPAYGGVLEVRPTVLSITPAQHVAVLSLLNPEESSAVYQVRIYRWTQKDDKQTLEPTNDLIASPPMVTLAPNGTQIVRIGLRSGALPSEEQTYRLVMEEVAPLNPNKAQTLNVALHVSLPLFLRPQVVLPPTQLSTTMKISGKNVVVTVTNKSHFTARIALASLKIPGVETPEIKTLTYILPGGWNAFTFRPPAVPSGLQSTPLTLQVDEGEIDLEAPVVSEMISDVPTPAVH